MMPGLENLCGGDGDSEHCLMDLASFNNVSNNAQMDFTGTHAVKNMNASKDATTNFMDHKDGQFSTVGTTNNAGAMNVSGNHMFNETNNTGKVNVVAR